MNKYIVKIHFPDGANPRKKYKFIGFEEYKAGDIVVVSNTGDRLSLAKVLSIEPYQPASGATRFVLCRVKTDRKDEFNLLTKEIVIQEQIAERISELEKVREKILAQRFAEAKRGDAS